MDVNFFRGAITSNPQWHSGQHASTVRGRIGVQFPVEEIFFKKKMSITIDRLFFTTILHLKSQIPKKKKDFVKLQQQRQLFFRAYN